MPAAVTTIVARNTLAHARVLAAGVARHAPGAKFHAVLADDREVEPSESFAVIPWSALGIPHEERWRFRYGQPDLCYAATPWAIAHLFDRGYDRVLFLKQETMVVGSLDPLFEALESASILLTPHLIAPLAGAAGRARELEVLLAGAYNAGVLGVAAGTIARRFLGWWAERLVRHCRRDVRSGMHYEQRWLDLAPSLFEEVHVGRDPGWNVGHWSLPERQITLDGDQVFVDGVPCRVARFSGHNLERPDWVTRHGQRLQTAALGPAAELFLRYGRALERAGDVAYRSLEPAWRRFDDGTEIPEIVRASYRDLTDDEVERFRDPFATGARSSFRAFLEEEEEGGVSRLWRYVHRQRPDLQRAFPDITGTDHRAFLQWTEAFGRVEYDLAREAES